jgi:hypothetical protein
MHRKGLPPATAFLASFLTGCAAPGAICWSGADRSKEATERLVHEAEHVCRAIAVAGGIPTQLMRDQGKAKLLYYVGHGQLGDSSARLELLPAGLGSAPVPASDLLNAQGKEGEPSAVILNSCDSGYADVRPSSGEERHPRSVVGAGYGWVTALPRDTALQDDIQGAKLTEFGHWTAVALEGAADDPPYGNCDGTVVDSELVRFVNAALADAARMSPHERKYSPFAVLKRQASVPVPLVKLVRTRACAAKRASVLSSLGAAISLPKELCDVSTSSGLVIGPTRYLLVMPRHGGATDRNRELAVQAAAELRETAGWRVIYFDGPDGLTLARSLAIYCEGAEFRVLRISGTNEPTTIFAELIEPREGSLEVIRELPSIRTAELELLLPARIRLVDLPGWLPIGSDAAPTMSRWRDIRPCADPLRMQPQLFIEVQGEVPRKPIALVAKAGQDVSPSTIFLDLLDRSAAIPVACPTPVGQCFMLANPGCERRPATAWSVEEQP